MVTVEAELEFARRSSFELALARRAVFDQRRRRIPGLADLLERWRRTSAGERRTDPVEWANHLSVRCSLHDLGRAALAHDSAGLLASLSTELDRLDETFCSWTTAEAGLSCSWVGLDPARWWYRRLPPASGHADFFRALTEQPRGDLSSLVDPYPSLDSAALYQGQTGLAAVESGGGSSARGAQLIGADLAGANVAGVDLTNADLTGADLTDADLSGADLTGVDLTIACANGANFRGAVLTDALLEGIVLRDADLSNADLTGAKVFDSDLGRATLTDAVLRGADLTKANLFDADLGRADLTGAIGIDKRIGRFGGARTSTAVPGARRSVRRRRRDL